MKWNTRVIYVDADTGELLTKDHIEKGIYVVTKSDKTTQVKHNTYGTTTITKHCQRNPQQRLFN